MIGNLELHPLCTYFPRMNDADFESLKADIKTNGQLHPIYLLDGMILDGGNRYRAMSELGIEPICQDYAGNNPVQFVLSSNLHRRHLTQGQAAVIVSATQNWANAHPAHRVAKEGGNVAPLNTIQNIADESGASHRTQKDADKLVKKATPELIKQVTQGEKSLNQALVEADLKPARKPENQSATLPIASDEPSLSDIIDDLHAMNKELEAENAVLKKAMESDDKVATLLKEVMVLTATNNALNSRLNGMNTERTEMIGRIKWLQKQLKKHAPQAKTAPTSEVDAWE
jgi:division protein CdvB (Snf7/Vps24/ESCRT-III family)